MLEPPIWESKQLGTGIAKSIELFREERLEEPLEAYLAAFDEYQGHLETLLERSVDLLELEVAAEQILSNAQLLQAFRYLAGPPISFDDLKTLADAASLAPGALRRDPELAKRIVRVIVVGLDRRRFPWVQQRREPTETERNAAIVASAALIATQRTSTERRSAGKAGQEQKVEDALTAAGFGKVPTRPVRTVAEAPVAGTFCGESKLGTRKADFILRLWDHRLMPIECKVSNSALNSVKRINNDAAVKAVAWREDFGRTQVVPVAVLSGVFKLHSLEEAQQRGLTLFWAHDLDQMLNWIDRAR